MPRGLAFAVSLGLALSLALGLAASSTAAPRPGSETITARAQALEVPALAAGESGELSLLLLEAPARELPLLVRIEASGLELSENRLDWSAVVDPLALQPRLRTRFRAPARAGRHSVEAVVAYSTCGERWCRQKRGRVRWQVSVTPAEAAPPTEPSAAAPAQLSQHSQQSQESLGEP